LNSNAVEVPSPAVDALCRAAKKAGAVVAMGMTERDSRSSRGTLYNSILYISGRGEVLGVHRKLMPTHAERIVWGQGDGSTLHVFETSVGRVGGLACWEHWMPLTRFAMHAKGEQIHVAAWPEVGDSELHRFATRHYAFEGRCFALCVMGARGSTSDRVSRSLRRRSDPDEERVPEAARLERVVDQEESRRVRAGIAAAVARSGGEEEPLALVDGERRATVVELVLDPPGEDIAPVAVRAPLLTRRAGLVLDDRPALAQSRGRPRMDVRLVVGPVDRVEVERAARAHVAILPEAAQRCSRNSTW
jgi:predicted amidohydrolase